MEIFAGIVLFLLFFSIFISIPYVVFTFIKNIKTNLNLASQILQAPIKSSFLGLNGFVEGIYKGRTLIFACHFLARNRKISSWVVPHNVVREKRGIPLNYLKPTKETYLDKTDIFYDTPLGETYKGLTKPMTEKELMERFDLLTYAAEVVETGKPFYRE